MYKTKDTDEYIEFWDNEGSITISKLRNILDGLCQEGYGDHYILDRVIDMPINLVTIQKNEGEDKISKFTDLTIPEMKAFKENGWKALRIYL